MTNQFESVFLTSIQRVAQLTGFKAINLGKVLEGALRLTRKPLTGVSGPQRAPCTGRIFEVVERCGLPRRAPRVFLQRSVGCSRRQLGNLAFQSIGWRYAEETAKGPAVAGRTGSAKLRRPSRLHWRCAAWPGRTAALARIAVRKVELETQRSNQGSLVYGDSKTVLRLYRSRSFFGPGFLAFEA